MNALLSSTSRFSYRAALLVLATISVIAIGTINLGWNGARIDLTENQLYTLSPGTKNILAALEQPVALRFYFSDAQTESAPVLRNYARRIRELLEEYQQASGGKIALQIIDPEPFSAEEEDADAYGLQRVRLSAGGDQLLLGLVGERAGGEPETIGFFHPSREALLEQDISKLIFAASRGHQPTVGIISNLDIGAWIAIEQLRKLYHVVELGTQDAQITKSVDLLLIVQPGTLSESTLYAIDQYVVGGGNAMIFADPINDLAQLRRIPTTTPEADASIARLLQRWGVKLIRDRVLGDARHSLTISRGVNNTPIRHLAIQAYGHTNFPRDDIVTRKLETVHVASSGVLEAVADSGSTFTPLIVSSAQSMLIGRDAFEPVPDPAKLYDDFSPSGERYTVAARISGLFSSAFPDGYAPPPPEAGATGSGDDATATPEQTPEVAEREHIASASTPVNLLVVADSDILTDRLWVRVQNFFGQQITSPFADNGDFLLNAVDNLLGNADLISIRGRGRYARPFEVVEELRRSADTRLQNKERELLARLRKTEDELIALQRQKEDGEEALDLNEEQISTLESFRAEKLKIHRELREVRHQLGSDIEHLGSWLKFINIALVPIVLTLGVLLFRARRRSRVEYGG